ncbi:hypothetical protein L3X38_003119 [Prunus dulcis]|uniref:Gnk2-homologous domain-containing protein n=1 Tax=Prunus dulcis TaxID=3755 RepID=A0AAD4ZLG7_PRUDU|nr:hypothetical protein L3X38_003119 [Prunus dulcis]
MASRCFTVMPVYLLYKWRRVVTCELSKKTGLLKILAQDDDASCTERGEYCRRCSDAATYTPGDMYQENLNSLLSSSFNTQNNYGFYNSSMGKHPNSVNAIALCSGDLSQDLCQACLNMSIGRVLQTCSTQRKQSFGQSVVW